MKYAISNWIYGDEPIEDSFNRLHRMGFEGIELVGEPHRYDRNQVRDLCAKYNIEVCSVLSWCLSDKPERDAAHPNPVNRKQAGVYLRSCVDLAESVGASIVIILPAPAGRTAPVGALFSDQEWDEAVQLEWDNAVYGTRELCRYAADKGITLAIEPLNRYESFLVTDQVKAKKFISDVGSNQLKIHLDTFHMSIEENDLAAVVKDAGQLLVNMHISDSNRQTPGKGHTDFPGILRSLKEISYDGYLVLEPVPPGSNPVFDATRASAMPFRDAYAKEGIAYLKQIEESLKG